MLVLLGADPLNDFTDRDRACRGLLGARSVVAVDLFLNDSAALAADVVLAAAGPTECDGTFTNLEGRVSAMSRKVTPPGTARPDWMIAAELAERLAPGSGLDSPEAIRAEMASVSELHRPLTEEALAGSPMEGVLLVAADPASPPAGREAPSVDKDVGGGFLLVATRTMYDDGTMLRHCPSSRGLAPDAYARVNPADLDRVGLVSGAPVRVSSARGHIEAVLVADDRVPKDSLAVNWLAPGAPANALIAAGDPVTIVNVEPR